MISTYISPIPPELPVCPTCKQRHWPHCISPAENVGSVPDLKGAFEQATRASQALNALKSERKFQDGKWGTVYEHGHTLGEWILLIEAELAEAKEALIKGGTGRNSVRSELAQVGALALAALEQHGTMEPHEGRQV